jgi:hypothetical protein
MIAFFDDAGFIVGSYVITFAALALIAGRLVAAGRKLGKQVPDDDKYWT